MEKINQIELQKKLGNQIRSIRKAKKLTLDDLSAHSGIDTSDIGKIERGEINIAFSTLCKLAFGLEVPLAMLVDFSI